MADLFTDAQLAAATWIKARPQIDAMVWFDMDRTSAGSGDWRIASSPESAAAFAALAADPCFARTNPL